MYDMHGAATPSGREQFVKDLAREINFKEVDRCELEKPYEDLKRLRIPMTEETRIQPNPKYLKSVANRLGLTCAKRPTPGVLTHRATMDATPLLTADDTRLYGSCVGALKYYVLDRADAQLEVSILGSYLRAPTSGAMEALRRATRYLLGTQDACVKLRIQNDDRSQWKSWDTQTATGLVTLREESHRAVVMWKQTAVH